MSKTAAKVLPLLSMALILATTACSSGAAPTPAQPRAAAPTATTPSAPVNVSAQAVSQTTINILWLDNSNNEDGFRIYRDTSLVATVAASIQTYKDAGLQPATTYQYAVTAYNPIGESPASTNSLKTLNPPVRIRLDRIGVYDNRESWPRSIDGGEVYVLVGIVDGNNSVTLKFPAGQDQHYGLDKNETVDIGNIIYSADAVGDSLVIAFEGYESDGGNFEQLAYWALGLAVDA